MAPVVMGLGLPGGATVPAPTSSPAIYSVSGNSNVIVNWSSTPDSSYDLVIERRDNGGAYAPVGTAPSTSGSYIDDNLANGSTYMYRARWSAGGSTGPTSASVPGTPLWERFYHRGNSEFSESSITGTSKTWYDRIRIGITTNKTYLYANVLNLASGDPTWGPDLYDLGRSVGDATHNAIASLRLTGDLRFLDWCDEMWQRARAKLSDYDNDGYRGWVWTHDSSNPTYYRKENHEQDAVMTHGIVALLAFTYAQNRDKPSPAGINYGERADFWRSYLLDDFIPKWTAINGSGAIPKSSFINFWLTHPWNRNALLHYYLWRLTGNTAYKSVADDHLAANFISGSNKNFISVSTGTGNAYVWRMGVMYNADGSATSNNENYLHESYYTTYLTQDFLDFYMDRHNEITDQRMTMVARAYTQYVMDNGITDIASTIGGDQARGGIPWANDSRKPQGQYAYFQFHALGSWDSTGKIASNAASLHTAVNPGDNDPTQINMAYGLLFRNMMGNLWS